MRLVLYAPAINEQTSGDEDASNTHCVQAVLGAKIATGNVLVDDAVAQADVKHLSDKGADSQTKEGKSSYSAPPTILFLKHSGKGSEKYVKIRICDRNIKRDGEADCREEQHLRGANDGVLEELAGS